MGSHINLRSNPCNQDERRSICLIHGSYIDCEIVRIQLSQRFKQFQEAILMLSNLYDKIPIDHSFDRSYYHFLYQHCVTAATNLLSQIQNFNSKQQKAVANTPFSSPPINPELMAKTVKLTDSGTSTATNIYEKNSPNTNEKIKNFLNIDKNNSSKSVTKTNKPT